MVEQEYDAYHPEVVDELVKRLIDDVLIWNKTQTRPLPAAYPHYARDLREALAYAGVAMDGYEMARYLEEHRRWPANQELVSTLGISFKLMPYVVDVVKNKNHNGSDESELKIGDMLADSQGNVYTIAEISSDGSLYTMSYTTPKDKTGGTCLVSRSRVIEDIGKGFAHKVVPF
jgi:hypothetical protein